MLPGSKGSRLASLQKGFWIAGITYPQRLRYPRRRVASASASGAFWPASRLVFVLARHASLKLSAERWPHLLRWGDIKENFSTTRGTRNRACASWRRTASGLAHGITDPARSTMPGGSCFVRLVSENGRRHGGRLRHPAHRSSLASWCPETQISCFSPKTKGLSGSPGRPLFFAAKQLSTARFIRAALVPNSIAGV